MKRPILSIATLVLWVLITAPACALSSDGSGASRRVAIGTTTSAGLVVRAPTCTYQSGQLTATGVLHVDGDEASKQIRVTVIVSGSAGGRFSRVADYPSPSVTGADVPFVIEVDTANDREAACEIQVDWAA